MGYLQGSLWDDKPTGAAPPPVERRSVRRARTATPAAVALPLWEDDPASPSDAADADERPQTAPSPLVESGVPVSAEPTEPASPPADVPADRGRTLAAEPRSAAPAVASPRRPTRAEPVRAAPKSSRGAVPARTRPAGPLDDEDGMAQASEWIDELLEGAGKAAGAVRCFVAAFPPEGRWGDPWTSEIDLAEPPPPFAPRADSYAAALREVMAGRRRVRVDGRWSPDQPGSVIAAARTGPSEDGPVWTLADALGR